MLHWKCAPQHGQINKVLAVLWKSIFKQKTHIGLAKSKSPWSCSFAVLQMTSRLQHGILNLKSKTTSNWKRPKGPAVNTISSTNHNCAIFAKSSKLVTPIHNLNKNESFN